MMARAAATPTHQPPSAVTATKPSTGAPSVRLLARPVSAPPPPRKRACACSPTTHPGSFRCALHRGQVGRLASSSSAAVPVSSGPSTIGRPPVARVSAVESGDSVRRALAGALVRPSSRPRRRAAFRPRPSRLSAVSYAADDDEPPSSRFQ